MRAGLSTSLDMYCERLDPSFWAEPVNALSNVAFVLAAIGAAVLAHQRGCLKHPQVVILIALIKLIAFGSFAFHTFATGWAAIADVAPITLFQMCFLGFYARDIARLDRGRVAMLLLGFIITSQTLGEIVPPGFLNGSMMYGGALLFLAGFAVYHRAARRIEPNVLVLATGIFIVSLTFRSIDNVVCETFTAGTHMFWHLLNAGVLYLVTRAYIVNLKPAAK